MTGIVWYLTIFVLAAFVGYEVISKVPSILHTPLMSGSNAIHGIVLVGSLYIMGEADGTGQLVLGFIAVFLSTLNIVGGFVVTDRMLQMFQAKPERAPAAAPPAAAAPPTAAATPPPAAPSAATPPADAPSSDTEPGPPDAGPEGGTA